MEPNKNKDLGLAVENQT
uniref:Truncated ClyII-B protein n=2 Tax=Actinobacillus TaxID=713 RepID=W0TYI3_ACTPL|nr:hypothetical protein (clyIIA 3' region) - Actinobacillus pleuropneumoniae (serotype 9) [Actinobacillus pleuropneumoniae]CAA43424.1 truncated ClyII-B protein [Actinobacillus pleuropneumoniae]